MHQHSHKREIRLHQKDLYLALLHRRLEIPQKVGEIDLIGYSQREHLLLMLECKLVRYSFERYFRDDISAFALAQKIDAEKFRRKIAWVRGDLPALCNALASQEPLRGVRVAPNHIAAAIVTLYPTMATCFINDMPCVSIAEIMVDYGSMNRWPYELGGWRV